MESAGVRFGEKSTDIGRQVFVPVEQVSDYAKHAMDSGPDTGESVTTTADAKEEVLRIIQWVSYVRCAVADAAVPRDEIANRAYSLGLLRGRAEARLQEGNIVKRILNVKKNRENAKLPRPSKSKRFGAIWLAEVSRLRKNDPKLSVDRVCELTSEKFRGTPHSISKNRLKDYISNHKKS